MTNRAHEGVLLGLCGFGEEIKFGHQNVKIILNFCNDKIDGFSEIFKGTDILE